MVTKTRLLVLNQYYWPGVEATAYLLSQLCEELADEFEITVVTGHLHGHDELPDEEVRNGVRIVANGVATPRDRPIGEDHGQDDEQDCRQS